MPSAIAGTSAKPVQISGRARKMNRICTMRGATRTMDTYRVVIANRTAFELSRPSAPTTAKQMAMMMEQIATKIVVPTPPRMYPPHLARKAVSIFPLTKRKPTRPPTRKIQVRTNVIRNRRVFRITFVLTWIFLVGGLVGFLFVSGKIDTAFLAKWGGYILG